jgi:ectoine hydroxylase-related dioxygenase (phytanoyl-CoA dioxygenase family)
MTPATTTAAFPLVDATYQECITDEQAQFFRDNGLLIIRNVVRGAELRAMQDETIKLVERAATERPKDPDYFYKKHDLTGEEVPFRVEYVIDKTTAAKALLGHPFILRSVEALQGRNFVPTWDSMVFKMRGAGASIPWHRDAGMDFYSREHFGTPIFNVDFYLDEANLTNCLWGIPGSNLWSDEEAKAKVAQLNAGGFKTDGAIPIPMKPGDVIFHNILVLHGSPPAKSKLRRVVYFEFRPGEIERSKGPHTPEYIPLKQRALLACLRQRAATPYARDEKAFVYSPSPEFAPPPLGANERLQTYRFPHAQYWRKPQ